MTDHTVPQPGTPQYLLSGTRELTRRVRAAQRGAWFPLLVFGVVSVASVPVNRLGSSRTCASYSAGRICSVYSTWSVLYWPIALVLAYTGIAAFYLRRSRQRGVGTRIQPYVIAGITVAVILTGLSIWIAHNPAAQAHILGFQGVASPLSRGMYRLLSPADAIGLALFVLARIERNWAMVGFSVAYLVIVLGGVTLGWAVTRPSPWVFLPHVLAAAGMLLIGSAGFAIAERHELRSAGPRTP
jgi:hypothetical protein